MEVSIFSVLIPLILGYHSFFVIGFAPPGTKVKVASKKTRARGRKGPRSQESKRELLAAPPLGPALVRT